MSTPQPPPVVVDPTATSAGDPNAQALVNPASNEEFAAEKPPDESSKIKLFLGILRKFIGVADIASVRFSLPAQLLEPRPNLEYWNYLDRPETFVAIGDSDDELGRMLEVLRFWFTKDLKYVHGKPCKPYNSTLGEFFRCNWEVEESAAPINVQASGKAPVSSSSWPLKSLRSSQKDTSQDVGNAAPGKLASPIKVSYLTEQTSHHPPVSAFFVDCPAKGITARGFDQIAAKFTGTSVKVMPGNFNQGIFIKVKSRDDEEYQLTHPAAYLGGILRGSLTVSVGDQCYVTCPRTKLKVILQYVDEGWLGKTLNKVEGIVFNYDPENDNITRLKDVADKDIVARLTGNWREKIFFSIGAKASEPQQLLVDVDPLTVASKVVPPLNQQLSNESIKFWSGVTNAIVGRQFSHATTLKQELEERQRTKAKQRQEEGTEWHPRFFVGAVSPPGKPELNDEGRLVLQNLQKGEYHLEESKVLGS